jgi:ABC-type nitrate/sulfonate/bicarbonate transport system substrate-binding protein
VLGAYEGQVLAARAAWAAANADTVTSMIRVFLRAVSWLREPAHRDEAFAIFCDRTPGAAGAAAATAHAVLFDPVHGFPADGAIDPRGLEQVVALRARYGRPAHPLASAAAYCEPRYLAAAAR